MNLEKMFQLKSKESENNKNKEEKEKEKGLDKNYSIDKLSKIGAVMAMFMMPSGLEAENRENKSEIELKIEDARIMLEHAKSHVNEHDREVKTLNDVQYREVNFEGEKNLKIAENDKYAILTKGGGEKAYLDTNCDGRVDRVVINEHHYKDNKLQSESDQRMMDNNFYFFDSIDNLEERAKVESQVISKPIKVVILDHEKKSVTIVDSEDGSKLSTTNGQGEAVIESLQSGYAHDLKELCRVIHKE